MPDKKTYETSKVGLYPVSERELDEIRHLRRDNGASKRDTSSVALVAEAIHALHQTTFGA